MIKSDIVVAVCAKLEQDLQRTIAAARAVEAAATDPESRSEGKYDTRGLEASYLAAGQSEQVDDMANALKLMQRADTFPEFHTEERIRSGALVEVEIAGERDFFLLAPAAGGLTIESDSYEVTVLAPGAPLRGKLEGCVAGDELESPALRVLRVS